MGELNAIAGFGCNSGLVIDTQWLQGADKLEAAHVDYKRIVTN